jgi:hypothetical protein
MTMLIEMLGLWLGGAFAIGLATGFLSLADRAGLGASLKVLAGAAVAGLVAWGIVQGTDLVAGVAAVKVETVLVMTGAYLLGGFGGVGIRALSRDETVETAVRPANVAAPVASAAPVAPEVPAAADPVPVAPAPPSTVEAAAVDQLTLAEAPPAPKARKPRVRKAATEAAPAEPKRKVNSKPRAKPKPKA